MSDGTTAARSMTVPSAAELAPTAFLILVAALCWAVTASRMEGMDMGPGTDLGSLGWFIGIWAVMMAAMMLPSLTPMELASARAASPVAAINWRATLETVAFAAGYLLVWTSFGLVAYGVSEAVRAVDPSWLAWDDGGRYVAGAVIVAAGLYELTPVKRRSLGHCRGPEMMIERRRPGVLAAARSGLGHARWCVGCSWAMMAALFALGVMSVQWMIVVAALIAVEKLLPWRRAAVGITIAVLVLLGLGVAFFPGDVPGLTVPMEMMQMPMEMM
jgi:predicted metal-binding membrane protein